MAVAKKRKPTTKTVVKATNKKNEAKGETKEVTASAVKQGVSDSPKVVKTKTTAKKSVKKEKKNNSDSSVIAKSTASEKSHDKKKEVNNSGITKVYQEKKDACTVTFRLPKAAVSKAKTVCIVGDFNDWNIYADPMTRRKDGTYSIELQLSKGKEYQFRYLIDDIRWENDWNADKYVKNPFGDSDNSVVVI